MKIAGLVIACVGFAAGMMINMDFGVLLILFGLSFILFGLGRE
jgi:hypothetical protein